MDAQRKKYPRTSHWKGSLGMTSDDKMGSTEAHAYLQSGIELIVTEKLDGSNYTIGREFSYGRSVDATTNLWDAPMRKLWSELRWDIPANMRISGENMYARKAISYDDMPSVFMVFGIWQDDVLLPWDEATEWCELLGLSMVPVLYRGTDFTEATKVWGRSHDRETSEGFVIRDAGSIAYDDFPWKVLKYVRANHVTQNAAWRGRDDFPLNTFVKP